MCRTRRVTSGSGRPREGVAAVYGPARPGRTVGRHLTPQHLTPQHLTPQHLTPQHLTPQYLTSPLPWIMKGESWLTDGSRSPNLTSGTSRSLRTTPRSPGGGVPSLP